jgi:hypothetical protein
LEWVERIGWREDGVDEGIEGDEWGEEKEWIGGRKKGGGRRGRMEIEGAGGGMKGRRGRKEG